MKRLALLVLTTILATSVAGCGGDNNVVNGYDYTPRQSQEATIAAFQARYAADRLAAQDVPVVLPKCGPGCQEMRANAAMRDLDRAIQNYNYRVVNPPIYSPTLGVIR